MCKKIVILISVIFLCMGVLQYSFADSPKENLFSKAAKYDWKILTSGRNKLYLLDLKGLYTSIFSESEDYYGVRYFSISPNGKKVLFLESVKFDEEFKPYLTIANIDGSNRERLLNARKDILGIRTAIWSPINEQEIALLSVSDYRSNKEIYSLYLFNLRTKTKQIIVRDLVSGLGIPTLSWAPDGSKIVFTSTEGKIMIVNKDNSVLRQVCDDDGTVPSWSPGGKTIIYREGKNYVKKLNDGSIKYGDVGSGKYCMIDINTSAKKEIFRNKWLDIFPLEIFTQPIWSPDGKYILLSQYYDKPFGGGYMQYRVIDIEKKKIIHTFNSSLISFDNISWVEFKD